MTAVPLSLCLQGRREPSGYVSFLSALVHHGVLVDALAVVQVASPEGAGRLRGTRPGPVELVPIPRDFHHGWRIEAFEGEVLPVASPEKAMVDWLWWAEERGLDTRLEEFEWEALDLGRLAGMLAEAGVELGARPGASAEGSEPAHDQARRRLDALRCAAARVRR